MAWSFRESVSNGSAVPQAMKNGGNFLAPAEGGAAMSRSGRLLFHAPASYWLDLRGYDPPSAAKALEAPMLILQGERDYQVTMDEFANWKSALGSRPNVTFHSYKTLNHLFIPGTGQSLPADYQVPGHVDEAVIRDIAAWINR